MKSEITSEEGHGCNSLVATGLSLQSESEAKQRFSEDDALQIINKLVQYGCFHKNHQEVMTPALADDGTVDDMHRFSNPNPQYSKEENLLIFSSNNSVSCCMTKQYLTSQITVKLHDHGNGRASVKNLSADLHVTPEDIIDSARQLTHSSDHNGIYIVGTEILSDEYLDTKCRELENKMKTEELESISNIAQEWKLPMQFTLDAISARMPSDASANFNKDNRPDTFFSHMKLVMLETHALVTEGYEQRLLKRTEQLLSNAEEPMKLSGVLDEVIHLDPSKLLDHIQAMCQEGILQGSLHDDSNVHSSGSTLGAIYTPNCFEEKQKESALSFFETNGYIMLNHGNAFGMSKKRMREFILHHNSRTILLEKCVLHPDIITVPVQATLAECDESHSFVNVSQNLPEGLSLTDTRTLIEDYIYKLSTGKNDGVGCRTGFFGDDSNLGHLLFTSGEAIYFSRGMINDIEKKLLPPLIEDFAKQRANEIADLNVPPSTSSYMCENPGVKHCGGSPDKKGNRCKKPSKRDKKRSKMKDSVDADQQPVPLGMIPLVVVAKAVMSKYPALANIQGTFTGRHIYSESVPTWEVQDGGNDDGPLYDFCREVISVVKLEQSCASAVKTELAKLLAIKEGTCVGATKVQNIESSFEESFKIACHLVQCLAKLPQSLLTTEGKHDHTEVISKLTKCFLHGCAADFARRITEYCLIKHGVEDTSISFHVEGGSDIASTDLGVFYANVDTSRRLFKNTHISSKRDPMKILREELPGGVDVARMWILISGENYSVSDLLRHLEDSCLSMCGFPFKLLDKKSEKQLLFARKKELQSQLQESSSGKDATELSIMLLFQQVKGMVVCGQYLTTIILDILVSDRKLPPSVSILLCDASMKIRHGEELSHDMITKVKFCGLSRDISKHVVEDS